MEQKPSTTNQETIDGASGLKIFFRSWRPNGKARGAIVIVPGFNAHSGYYIWVAEQFVAMGFAVYAVDLRGRGNSDGERFYVEKFEDYVNDVESVVAIVKSREQGLPLFMLGHSAGGVVSCLYTLDHQAELAGLICESLPQDGFSSDHIAGPDTAWHSRQEHATQRQPAFLRHGRFHRQDTEALRRRFS